MTIKEIRIKLMDDFRKRIDDKIKLNDLEGVFDAINNEESSSVVSDEQYLKVDEARTDYLSGSSAASSWDEVEKHLTAKYRF